MGQTIPGRLRLVFVLLVLALASACQAPPRWALYDGESRDVFPGETWAKAESPEVRGWSSADLAAARAFSREIGSTAVMIVESGVVVDAWGGIATKSNLHSVRKSLLSGLIGIAVDEGKIDLASNLEELGIDDNEPSLTPVEKQATVGDLIKARSGIYHAALYETRRMTASKPPRGSHEPGSFWHYNNWDFNALGTIYEQQTGETIFESFEDRIAGPLQMEDYRPSDGEYVTGAKSEHAAYPFRMTARDLARFALLYLREGRWADRQIVSADWVAESTAAHSSIGAESGYGYMWWTGSGGGVQPNVLIPAGGYFAAGWGGQYAFVFPSLDLVVVHRVNTDGDHAYPANRQIGRLLWMILAAKGLQDIGPDPSIEGAEGTRLTGDALASLGADSGLMGKNSDGTTWRMTLTADGRTSGVAGRDGEFKDQGTWRVDGDRFCVKWDNWREGRERCFGVVRDGDELKSYDPTGTYRSSMTLVTGE